MKRTLLPILLLVVMPFIANAQLDANKLLKDINGKVDEIIIKSDGMEYTFSGDEAEKLFLSMKEDKKMKHFSFFTKDGKDFHSDSLHKKIILRKLDDDFDSEENEVLVFIDENDSSDADMKMINKKVIVSKEDGKKVVTVTINDDGKENIEVYEGNAADEYLDDMKSDKEFDVKFHDGSTFGPEDVIASFYRAQEHSDSVLTDFTDTIDSIVKVGTNSIKITTKQPSPNFLPGLATAALLLPHLPGSSLKIMLLKAA